MVLREADDAEGGSPELDAISKRKPRPAIGDHFEMALPDRPATAYALGPTWACRLEADDVKPDLPAQVLCLDRLVGDRACLRHTGKPCDPFAAVAGNARGFGEGPS